MLDDYSVKVICKSTESSGKVLAIPLNSTGNGVDLTQRTYTDNSDYSDEWYLLNITGSEGFLLGITDTGHDHHSSLGSIMTQLVQLGYKDFNYTITNDIDYITVLQNMADSKVYVSRSHGTVGNRAPYILLKDIEEGEVLPTNNTLGSYDIYDFDTDTAAVDLSNCDFVLFVGCETGKCDNRSLPYAAVAAGATCAIGFKDNIGCENANEWTKAFFNNLAEGKSIAVAAEEASGTYENDDDIGSYVIVYNIYTENGEFLTVMKTRREN